MQATDIKASIVLKENEFKEFGNKKCSNLKVVLKNEGILGGPHFLKMVYAFDGQDITIEVEQCGVRTIRLVSSASIAMSSLWNFYSQIEQFLMLLDGRFYYVESVLFSGDACSENEYAVYATECLRRRLSCCKTDPVYCYSDHCFLEFKELLMPELLSKWIILQEQLDIVHQVVLYNIADTGITHDVKCANLIECLEPMTEIISVYDHFFPNLKPGERTTTLKMCIDAVISKYGKDIFSQEYTTSKDRFLQVLVNTRNRIMHIKRNQPKDKYLSGPESVLYLVKFCHLYRVVLLSLLGVNYSLYQTAVTKSVERWNSWEGMLSNFITSLSN